MLVPAAVTQAGALTVDMTGLARPSGDRVQFDQTEDTFLELKGWSLLEGELFDALVLDHVVSASTVFTVVLVRGW